MVFRRSSGAALRRLFCALSLAGAALPALAEGAAVERDRLLPFEVVINSNPSGNWVLLEHDGVLYAPPDAFDEWRVIRARDAKSFLFRGQPWFPLSSVPGYQERRNMTNQSVDLVFSPAAFAATRLSSENAQRPTISPTIPALFLNYDLSLTQASPYTQPSTRGLEALTELAYSTGYGILSSSYVAHNLMAEGPIGERAVRRLETSFTRDYPDQNITVRVGDGSTRSSLSGRSVYFGGLQIANNFALTPGFVTQPIPTIAGVSRAPSTLSLYINDALRQTSTVPTGPFAIENFPMLTGAGEARVVVKDLLGRETVVTQSFFTDPNLLEKGLSDWSFETGALRLNLGTENFDYGDKFASGVLRYGVSQSLTVEGYAQVEKAVQDGGVGLSFALPLAALGQAGLSVSHGDDGVRGYEWLLGAEHDSTRHGFSLRAQGASRNYRQLGLDADVLPQRLALSSTYVYSSAEYGALNLGLAKIAAFDDNNITTVNVGFTARIGGRSSLSVNLTRVYGKTPGSSIGALLTVPLGGQVMTDSNLTHKGSRTEGYAGASRGITSEIGVGWRTLAGYRSQSDYGEAGLYYQGARALLTADISQGDGQRTERVGGQGGLVLIDGRVFASRRLDDSFALVEVPGYPNVGIGFQGSTITRTDADGVALLPRLLPYQRNSIRLDPTELPISAELDTIEQVVAPAGRSGIKVVFPVRSGRGALIRIVLENGQPAPAGAQIVLVGDKQEFFVARRGEAFVTGLNPQNRLKLSWKGGACELDVALPPGKPDDIARVGPLTCKAVSK